MREDTNNTDNWFGQFFFLHPHYPFQALTILASGRSKSSQPWVTNLSLGCQSHTCAPSRSPSNNFAAAYTRYIVFAAPYSPCCYLAAAAAALPTI